MFTSGELICLIRCLHLSDMHLGYLPGQLGRKSQIRADERNDLLRKAIDIALTHDVNLVIIAGDLFDNHRPEGGLVESVLRELSRAAEAGIAVITLPGNHDEITYRDSVYRRYAARWPGVLVTNPQPALSATLSISGETVFIYGVAYTGGITEADSPITTPPRVSADGIHIGVFHGSLDWNAGERSLPLDSRTLAQAGYNYVALGHYHRFMQQQIDHTLLVYPGASEAKGYSDPGTGSVVLAEISQHGSSIQRLDLGLRKFQEVTLNPRQVDDTLRQLTDQELALRVILKGITDEPVDIKALEARCSDAFYHLEIRDETEYLSPAMIEQLSRELSVRGAFIRRMQQLVASAEDGAEKQLRYRALEMGLRAFKEAKR